MAEAQPCMRELVFEVSFTSKNNKSFRKLQFVMLRNGNYWMYRVKGNTICQRPLQKTQSLSVLFILVSFYSSEDWIVRTCDGPKPAFTLRSCKYKKIITHTENMVNQRKLTNALNKIQFMYNY
jgi:hypothetical protein